LNFKRIVGRRKRAGASIGFKSIVHASVISTHGCVKFTHPSRFYFGFRVKTGKPDRRRVWQYEENAGCSLNFRLFGSSKGWHGICGQIL